MAVKKVRKNFWEKFFLYPSFNVRFGFTLFFIISIFIIITYYVLRVPIINNVSDKIVTLDLIIQSATLVLGIFAVYYALRQLVETGYDTIN